MSRQRSRERGHKASDDLQANHLHKSFGGIQAIQDVSFELPRGSVLGVIGPNGSGKTTLVNLLSGAYRPDSGSVRLGHTEMARSTAHKIAALGIARTFQNPHVFQTLTVRQNMLISFQSRRGGEGIGRAEEDTEGWLSRVGLSEFIDRVAHELSGGQQKLVEFARAMVRQPQVVLMDEPFAGVHAEVKSVLHARIAEISRSGQTSFLIVSHEIPDLVKLSDHFLCMANGKVLLTGTPSTVCQDPRVIEAYLGAPLGDAA